MVTCRVYRALWAIGRTWTFILREMGTTECSEQRRGWLTQVLTGAPQLLGGYNGKDQ